MADNYKLAPHARAILEEYREQRPVFAKMQETIPAQVRSLFEEAGIVVASIESRVKEEKSLVGKLELKGAKYGSLADITDIFGMRIITFYVDDVDKVASVVERLFEIDWDNSVDKRKIHEVDRFGYMSLHYICRHPDFPFRFEVQMRTILQHAWANMNHDTGYKTDVEVPVEYMRNMNRLAGMLELVDEQFSRIRTEINDYRRRVQSLVASSVGPQNLCLAYLLKKGGGRAGIRMMLDTLNGPSESNDTMAEYILAQAEDFSFMHTKD